MSDRTAANSTNGQGGPGDHNGNRQTESASENAARSRDLPTSLNNEHNNDSSQRCQHICQQQLDLHYYRKFLEDLVVVVRDANSDSVARLISLIRSGASNEEIHSALQRVQADS
ncbi:hypothetical protein LT330_009011 [Penicillium expansum]|nr:hypothetical protein LT330_009011 [Penicillium expansum]